MLCVAVIIEAADQARIELVADAERIDPAVTSAKNSRAAVVR
jgi:hypothetical protein